MASRLTQLIGWLTKDHQRIIRHCVADLKWDRNGFCAGGADGRRCSELVDSVLMERAPRRQGGC